MDQAFEQRFNLAKRLFLERRYGEAAVIFDWLCEVYPQSAAAIIEAARTSSYLFDYNAVSRRFAYLESAAELPSEIWLAMANISRWLRRPEWAKRYLSNAVSKCEATAEACGIFAVILERSNDLDQAVEMSDRGLKIDPSYATCQLVKARVYRRKGLFDASDSLLNALILNPAAQSYTRISAYYELAQLKDLADDCAGAIAELGIAKQLYAGLPEYSARVQQASAVERFKYTFVNSLSAAYFKSSASWRPAHPGRMALLGGHARSGTTLLEQMLDSHTEIISAEETQVFASTVQLGFNRELLAANNASESATKIPDSRIEQMRSSYFRTMQMVIDSPLSDQLLLDKNPSLTDCIPIFSRVFPECLYVILLRDPRDVVLSCFFQDFPLSEATVRFQSLKETAMHYANTMSVWLISRENIDQKQWIEVRYESLVNNIQAEVERVMSKLALRLQPQQLQPDVHAKTKAVLSPTYADVTKPVHSAAVGRWKRYEQWMGEAIPILEPFIRAFGYSV